jgi:xylan 1,4-beta-xylosidase
MKRLQFGRSRVAWALAVVSSAALIAACSSSTKPGSGDAGRDGSTDTAGDGSGGDVVDHPVKACSDPAPWTPPAAPAACGDAPPTPPSAAATVTLAVDVASVVRPWNRFYEKTVASDHAHTVLCTAYGRNTQNALRKAHAQAGFQYVRFHALFDDDDAVYTEDAAGNPLYDWSSIDAIYDAIVAAGMRPLAEISFTPGALASDPTMLLGLLWYNNVSPNISPPNGASGDWSKWTALMTAFVRHLEDRYGVDEVRAWYFEIWNEPSWMYSLGDDGYFDLYKNTVAGLVAADSEVRVGGPAGSSGESTGLIQKLIAGSINTKTKLDFLTYHRYGDDDGVPIADVTAAIAFHDSLMSTINATVIQGTTFTGEVLNDEFGPSYKPDISRDNEVAATYIVKTIHLLGSDTTSAPPASYGYWAISDLYEEIYTGTATAYRPGNFGLLLKGDPKIPESFDVAKPAFNAFRLLHMMGDQQLAVTGGTTADGVNAAATKSTDGSALQVLVYNHVEGGAADSSQSSVVSLALNNLPFSGPIRIRQYIVDRGHANSYRAWLTMGSPTNPTQPQWVTLRDSAELCYYETTAQPVAGSSTLEFAQSIYGVDLFEISAAPATPDGGATPDAGSLGARG